MSIKPAQYHPAIRPEHRGNPLVEALPLKKADDKVMQALRNKVPYDPSERELSACEREEYIDRLDDWRMPVPEYLDCFRMVEKALIGSYGARNPFSPTTNHYLHYLDPDETAVQPKTGRMKTKGSAGSIVGVSGTGKSEMIDQILNYFDQVSEHSDYEGKQVNIRQVVWLKVTCLDNMSLRGLCHSILEQLDEALQRPYTKPATTIALLLNQIEKQIRSNFVGLIAVDEMQGLTGRRSGGKDLLMTFLLNLIDRSGITLLFCGNEELLPILKGKLWVARRAEAQGYIQMNGLSPDMWSYFVRGLWFHQWTDVPTPLTDELSDKLYRLSTGIIGIAVRIYKKAQCLVIGSGDERITAETLEMAYDSVTGLTNDELELRRQSSVSKLMAAVDDWPDRIPAAANTAKPLVSDDKPKKIFGDLTRPQHMEFADRLTELGNTPFLAEQIQDMDLLRRQPSKSEESLLDGLKEDGVLMDDPLAALV